MATSPLSPTDPLMNPAVTNLLTGQPAYSLAPAMMTADAANAVPKPQPTGDGNITMRQPTVKVPTTPTPTSPQVITPSAADLDLAQRSGIKPQALIDYMAKNPGVNPDAAIGNLLSIPTSPAAPSPVPPPSVIPSPTGGLTQDTSGARDQRTTNQAAATNLLSGVQGLPTAPTKPGEISADPTVQAAQAARDAAAKAQAAADSGQFTPEQMAQINADVAAAKAKYQFMVDQANQNKERDFSKSIVAMGQTGGLMSTQMSGLAALLPEAGGKYTYTGGEIGFLQSNYNRDIAQAISNQNAAMDQARQSAIRAIQTGKKDDLVNAQNAYNEAVQQFQKGQEITATYNRDYLNWAKTTQDMQKQQMDMTLASDKAGMEKLKTLAQGGASYSDIPVDELNKIKTEHGWTDFETQQYFNAQLPEAKKANSKVEVKGDYAVTTTFNPKTNQYEITSEKIQGLPPNFEGKFTSKIDSSGTMYLIPDVPDTTKPIADQMIVVGKPGQFASKTTSGATTVSAKSLGITDQELRDVMYEYRRQTGDDTAESKLPMKDLVYMYQKAKDKTTAFADFRAQQLTAKKSSAGLPAPTETAADFGSTSQ